MKELEHLKVLDLSSVLAGPSVGTFLAELGAHVIKVEKPGGDVTRNWRLPNESSDGVSAYYASVNYGKEVHYLDLSEPSAQQQIHRWMEECDVLIENYKHADLEKFSLTPESIASLHPHLVHCHLQGFEFTLDRVAYDVVLQAETGFMYMNGSSSSGPIKMPVALIDVLAAHQMKQSILLGLYQRERTGKGSSFNVSLEGSALAALVNQASNYLMAGHVAQPLGTQHPNIAPYGDLYKSHDNKWIVLAIGSDRQFEKMVTHLGAPELASDRRFQTNPQRVSHRQLLNEALAPLFAQQQAAPFLVWCHENFVPAGSIRSMDEVCDSALAKSMKLEEEQEGMMTTRLSSVAFKRN
ncbi:MAG: CoA transferase [Flavobacteriales bacterium]|nr:CoA transferase [Flavobacteriales bacterium]